ncbi:unnamed protein product, partial [Mesorhabditis belari]|uniref:Uncharacterized protein n=1 Tax=Mesorhabditis belari TaxID=2138241 RepID=A0AAF3F4I9_9BILA
MGASSSQPADSEAEIQELVRGLAPVQSEPDRGVTLPTDDPLLAEVLSSPPDIYKDKEALNLLYFISPMILLLLLLMAILLYRYYRHNLSKHHHGTFVVNEPNGVEVGLDNSFDRLETIKEEDAFLQDFEYGKPKKSPRRLDQNGNAPPLPTKATFMSSEALV